MRASPFSQAQSKTVQENTGATGIVGGTEQMARACLMPDWQLLLRGGHAAARLASYGVRAAPSRPRSAISMRDVRRTRAELEAERCKAFCWAYVLFGQEFFNVQAIGYRGGKQ